jgi:hypothetical protein
MNFIIIIRLSGARLVYGHIMDTNGKLRNVIVQGASDNVRSLLDTGEFVVLLATTGTSDARASGTATGASYSGPCVAATAGTSCAGSSAVDLVKPKTSYQVDHLDPAIVETLLTERGYAHTLE